MFCPHIFVVTNSYYCFFKKRIKNKNEFFLHKGFEIGYVLTFSSVKISIRNTVKPIKLYLLYVIVYMHIHRRTQGRSFRVKTPFEEWCLAIYTW